MLGQIEHPGYVVAAGVLLGLGAYAIDDALTANNSDELQAREINHTQTFDTSGNRHGALTVDGEGIGHLILTTEGDNSVTRLEKMRCEDGVFKTDLTSTAGKEHEATASFQLPRALQPLGKLCVGKNGNQLANAAPEIFLGSVSIPSVIEQESRWTIEQGGKPPHGKLQNTPVKPKS